MELTFSSLGTGNPGSSVSWLGGKARGLDLKLLSTRAVDVGTRGSGGVRYFSATYQVRNAQDCRTPGTCTPYRVSRTNVTFLAAMLPASVNETAVSGFESFNSRRADPNLALQLLPTHGMEALGQAVVADQASLQVYRESELPVPDSGKVKGLFPYGFVVRNAADGTRTLSANPAANQYDGQVTFAFKIPLQANASNDLLKVTLTFQAMEDQNTRVTQSSEEQSFAGDVNATARAVAVSSTDLAVLGARVAQTPLGDPICQVRIAGTAGAPTAYLANNSPGVATVRAAPMNLEFMDKAGEVSVGLCQNLTAPDATTLYVHGSQSGMRKVGAAYGGTITGGGATNRPNQLVWNIAGQKPFFIGETVSFVATAGNTTAGGAAITPFVGSFRVKGSSAGSLGTFELPIGVNVGHSQNGVALGDVNGDGTLDIVVANYVQFTVSVLIGDGSGGFGAPTYFVVGREPYGLTLGDVDGDGKLDIVTANFQENTVAVLIGDGTGQFGPATPHAVGVKPFSVALGDLNGDGKLDIVAANIVTNDVSVLIGDGTGGFSPATGYPAGTGAAVVTLGDVNGDGKLDIVVANYLSNNVSVLIGNGAGGFSAAANFAAGAGAGWVSLGDVNSDGKLDIVTADYDANTVSVLIGNGLGGFGPATNFAVGAGPSAVSLGDVNGDGKLDIVSASFTSNGISVLIGDGSGGFGGAANFGVSSNAFSTVLGDVNGDGKLDIVLSGRTSSASVSVLLGL